MDLLEYQAKDLFREMDIPVLPAQRIDHPKDLKGLKIPYPVVIKSQVRRGGRGRAGGVRFVANTIDAVAAAQTIFNLPIMGEYPEVLLAEAKYDADQEFYLAIALDSSARRPVLLGSQQGGVQVETSIATMQQVVVEQEFSPFYARRLALKMGLQGDLILAVSGILEKMYQLFVQKDLDLIEINPLAVSANGEVMALDGKVTVNDGALGRHPDLALLSHGRASKENHPKPLPTFSPIPHVMELDGNIGILCNGAGLTMATLDLVSQAGGKPANFVTIGGETYTGWNPLTFQARVQQGLEWISQEPGVKVILINLLSGVLSCQEIAQVIRVHLQQMPVPATQSRSRSGHQGGPRFVVRLAGKELAAAQETLSEMPVYLTDRLDDAVAQAIALTKSTAKSYGKAS